MQFKKLGNNSIRCIISRQELDEEGLKIDDLVDDREKAEEFLKYVLAEARYAVDFRMTGNVINVQMSTLPDGGVSLMISDDADSAIRNMLSEMQNHLAALREASEDQEDAPDSTEDPAPDQLARVIGEGTAAVKKWEAEEIGALPSGDRKPDGGKTANSAEQEDRDAEWRDLGRVEKLPLWAGENSLDDCIRLCSHVAALRKTQSTLYRYDGRYYLHADLVSTRRELAGIAFSVAEYSNGMFADAPSVAEIVEHGTVIIRENAGQVLAELA